MIGIHAAACMLRKTKLNCNVNSPFRNVATLLNSWSMSQCVCPTGRKMRYIWSKMPQSTKDLRYANKYLFLFSGSNRSKEWWCTDWSIMTWFYFVGECVKRNNTYLHVLSSWRNQVPGSLPFLSMYARRVLQGVAIKQCVLSKGNLFVKHHKVRKDLWITSTTALVPLGMFPEKRFALANSPCTRAAYSLVCNGKANTGTQCKQMAS